MASRARPARTETSSNGRAATTSGCSKLFAALGPGPVSISAEASAAAEAPAGSMDTGAAARSLRLVRNTCSTPSPRMALA